MANILTRYIDSLFHVYQWRDLSAWDNLPQQQRPIYGVYHIFCLDGWQELVKQQITTIRESGLLDATDHLYVSVITNNPSDVDVLKLIVNSPKLVIISNTNDATRYEYPALEYVREIAEKVPESLIYYFHTKGISYQTAHSRDARFHSFQQKIIAWREMLEYFIFERWHVAVNVLCDGYDTYGCYRWPPRNYKMYSGSFWWAKAEYINTLPPFQKEVIRSNRFYSEVWLYERAHHDFSAFDTLADLYYVRILPSLYKREKPPLYEVFRFVLIYNWRKFLKHVFHINYKKRNQERFQRLISAITSSVI